MIINACITVIKSRLTPADTCISLPPATSAPKSILEKNTPMGCARPSKATAIASKPIPAENPLVARPNTPEI